LSKGNNFVIKLHGSCNWKSFDDSDTMVIGRGKKSKILKEPLLRCYFEIFEKVLCEGSHNLIVIGYGFRDKHINSVLAKAVKKGLKIYILSHGSPGTFKENLLKDYEDNEDKSYEDKQNREIIWEGLAGYSQYVEEVLKGYSRDSVKKRQFYKIVFGSEKYEYYLLCGGPKQKY
jgi:hypothetical protein